MKEHQVTFTEAELLLVMNTLAYSAGFDEHERPIAHTAFVKVQQVYEDTIPVEDRSVALWGFE